MAKACASHGSRNTGPSASRGIPGTASVARRVAARSMAISGRLQIGLESFDRYRHRRIGVIAPQFARVEADGVEPLRMLALANRGSVREDVATLHALDNAGVPAHVTRQPGMRCWIDIPGPHAVARLEPGGCGRRPPIRTAGQHAADVGGGEFALQGLARAQGVTACDLILCDEIAFEQPPLQPQKPFPIIGAGEIDVWPERLKREPGHVDIPLPGGSQRAVHRHHPRFPRGMENRFVRLRLDFAEPVHAAHVVDAVHATPSCGRLGRPVPIMESRVTRLASRSSLQPSVLAGRAGSTRNRVSAVESHTRISVSFGRATPKSARTPRGSFTARDRYGADLYQTGGKPSTSHG